jgi:mannose-6-phosphate isomerase-like protein (cupin superfamily)
MAAMAALPEAWRSRIVGRVGPCNLKIIRMDEKGIPHEVHPDYEEALLVLEGRMDLEVGAEQVSLGTGDLYVIPAGVPHRVLPGSFGLLLLVDR